MNKSTGLVALFRFFRDVYLSLCRKQGSPEIDTAKLGDVFSLEMYLRIFKPMKDKMNDNEFTSQNFDPGGSGRSQLFRKLLEISGLK